MKKILLLLLILPLLACSDDKDEERKKDEDQIKNEFVSSIWESISSYKTIKTKVEFTSKEKAIITINYVNENRTIVSERDYLVLTLGNDQYQIVLKQPYNSNEAAFTLAPLEDGTMILVASDDSLTSVLEKVN